MQYYGLYFEADDDEVGLHTGLSMEGKSDRLSFARKYEPETNELHPVQTVNTKGLINIKMYDFQNNGTVKNIMQGAYGSSDGIYNVYNNSGKAAMYMSGDFPDIVTNDKTTNVGSLFNQDTYVGDANHLFLLKFHQVCLPFLQ